MVMQDQHAAPGGGQGEGLGAEHPAGTGREGDASALLHGDDPVAPPRRSPLAVPLVAQGQCRPGGGLGSCRAAVSMWERVPDP